MADQSNEIRRAIQVDLNRAIWKAYILHGSVGNVRDMLNSDFTANEPLDENMRSPLVDIALHIPEDQTHARRLAETASALIGRGALLNNGDYKKLVPLDYALICPNRFLAEEVFISTLRHSFLNQECNRPYRPHLGIIFRTMPDETQRRYAYANLITNLGAIRKRLLQTMEEGDPYILGLNHEVTDYWITLVPPPYDSLLKAPQFLRDKFQKIATVTAQYHNAHIPDEVRFRIGKRLVRIQEDFRMMEWELAQKLTL